MEFFRRILLSRDTRYKTNDISPMCTGHHELNIKIGQGCDDENAFGERYDSRKWLVIHRSSVIIKTLVYYM